jgi:hypothetical protein
VELGGRNAEKLEPRCCELAVPDPDGDLARHAPALAVVLDVGEVGRIVLLVRIHGVEDDAPVRSGQGVETVQERHGVPFSSRQPEVAAEQKRGVESAEALVDRLER